MSSIRLAGGLEDGLAAVKQRGAFFVVGHEILQRQVLVLHGLDDGFKPAEGVFEVEAVRRRFRIFSGGFAACHG